MTEVVRETTAGSAETPPVAASDKPSSSERSRLSEIERVVVGLSCSDPLSSLDDRLSLRGRVGGWLGGRTHTTLADPRLEALRRYAVAARLRGDVVDTRSLLDAGFSVQQAAEVDGMVARRKEGGRRSHGWTGLLILGLVATTTFLVIVDAVGDRLVGLVLSGLVVAATAPLILPRRHHR